MTLDFDKVWLFLKTIFIDPPWQGTITNIFKVNAYMKIFTATITLAVSLIILNEIRRAPKFIKTVVVAIVVVSVSKIVV